jgi:hypothetical protein
MFIHIIFDRSPIETDTFLCTYFGPASDILPNDQVEQKIKIPAIRENLKSCIMAQKMNSTCS